MQTKFELWLNDFHKKEYTLIYFQERNEVRLVGYKELSRESTRKRIWTVDRWYDWYNKKDRYKDTFIPIDQIVLPQIIKQRFIEQLVEGLTFITTEGK